RAPARRRAGAGARAATRAAGTRARDHAARAGGLVRRRARGGRLRARRARGALRRPARPPDARAAPRAARRAGPRSRPSGPVEGLVGAAAGCTLRPGMDDVYDLYTRGQRLLEAGHFHQATVPLAKARDLEPEKTSIREALGRAYFRSHHFEQARAE